MCGVFLWFVGLCIAGFFIGGTAGFIMVPVGFIGACVCLAVAS